jgi:hypothetical protein
MFATFLPRGSPSTQSRSVQSRTVQSIAVLLLVPLVLALSACSAGGVPSAISSALEQSSSAVESTIIAVDLEKKGDTITSVSQTTAQDMLEEIQDAEKSVVDTEVEAGEATDARDAALDAIREGVTAILLARDTVPHLTAASADSVAHALSASADALDEAAKTAEKSK